MGGLKKCCFLCRGALYCEAEERMGHSLLCGNCWAQLPLCQNDFADSSTGDYSLGYYLDILEELLKLYKLERHLVLGQLFADMLEKAYRQKFAGAYLVPIPPRPAKIKYEAWDQIAYLCRILQRKYQLPVLNLLQRHDNRQHKKLGRAERQLQSAGDYSLLLAAERRIWGQCKMRRKQGRASLRLLLLDDVYTTGATIGMCRKALAPLKQAGFVEEISSLTICRVP